MLHLTSMEMASVWICVGLNEENKICLVSVANVLVRRRTRYLLDTSESITDDFSLVSS